MFRQWHWLALAALLATGFVAACSAPPRPPEELNPGHAITRKIWRDSRFTFEGKTGEVVTLKVTGKTPGVDPRVTLLDPEHIKEAFDDDSGGNGNSLIKDHALKRSGRYTVVVGLAGSDAGEVEILLAKL